MSVKIKKEIQKIENDIIGYRRNFHQYPELSFKEFKTADTICNHLDTCLLYTSDAADD